VLARQDAAARRRDGDDFPLDGDEELRASPATNPFFAGAATPRRRTIDLALRIAGANPWRDSFDPTGPARPVIGDVAGQKRHRGMIDFSPQAFGGLNFAGAALEGNSLHGASCGCTCNAPALTRPV
jgi:hypothetical protein